MTLMITIVRHGDTFAPGEAPRRIGARTDLPLTPNGRAQAAALGTAFDHVAFGRAFTSPLARTRETAAAIVAAAEPADWLAEIDHGPDEGCTEAVVEARVGAAALAAWDADGIAPPGWNVDRDARIAAWRRLFAGGHGEGRILCVTSNGAARFALLAAGLRPEGGLKLRTGAWGTIAAGSGAPRLVDWNLRPAS